MNTHVMVDIETLGTACDAPILSIGAVAFDIESGEISAKFYRGVDPTSALERGRADGATLRWWMTQSDAARSAAFSGNSLIAEALAAFRLWYAGLFRTPPIWANGPSFDISILETAFRTYGMKPPWKYNAARCVRTIKAIAGDLKMPTRSGVEHNALDDAIYQAACVCACWRALKQITNTGALPPLCDREAPVNSAVESETAPAVLSSPQEA